MSKKYMEVEVWVAIHLRFGHSLISPEVLILSGA
jgi:hypothetical protein